MGPKAAPVAAVPLDDGPGAAATSSATPTDTISGPEFRAYMADMARTVSRLASQVESLTDSVGTIADQISDDSEQTKSTARDCWPRLRGFKAARPGDI